MPETLNSYAERNCCFFRVRRPGLNPAATPGLPRIASLPGARHCDTCSGVATDSAFLSVGFFRCCEAKVAACPIPIDHVRLPLGYPATKPTVTKAVTVATHGRGRGGWRS